MIFSGLPFLLGFLPLFLAGTALVGWLREQWLKPWLLLLSLLFYAIGAPGCLPFLLLSVACNYLLLWAVHRLPHPRRWAVLGVLGNLVSLGWFKLAAAGAVPLGFSFFTFTQIGCLLHQQDDPSPPPKPLDYALLAAFFPALLAGPVLNGPEMLPQFARHRGWRLTNGAVMVGLGFFLLGLLKKTVLADPLAPMVAARFDAAAELTLLPAWQAAAFYSLQLYFDFSGYTDMAIGLAWMVGLRYPDNFAQPYRARCVIDYWQRWHMSLTRFLVATVHAPLTLSVLRWRRRRGLAVDQAGQRTLSGFAMMIAAPILLTMLLVSLWHGDHATFLLFGLLHASFLSLNHVWRVFRGPALPDLLSLALTYLCVLIGGVMFRAATPAQAFAVLSAMSGLHGTGSMPTDFHALAEFAWLLGLYAIIWLAPTVRQVMLAETRFAWRDTPAWAVAMGGAATLGVLAAGGTGEFLYARF
ncbi:MAG TPA: MBOAT family O-acyltransferase [Rhodopila sp.]|nr:MBOAT family O-acyltransferase [Rhodopila sp.]